MKQQYYRALEAMVSRVTGACYVRASNAVLRRSSIVGVHTRPIGDNAPRGPVNDVHCDFAPGAAAIGLMQAKQERIGLGGARFVIMNCWKNVGTTGPVSQWPMAVCDASSVEREDLVARSSPENGNIILNVLPSSAHRWYSFPLMTTDEVLMFKQHDTVAGGATPVPHTAFDDVVRGEHVGTPPPVRESCELRVMCFHTGGDLKYDAALQKLDKSGLGVVSPAARARWGDAAASKL